MVKNLLSLTREYIVEMEGNLMTKIFFSTDQQYSVLMLIHN